MNSEKAGEFFKEVEKSFDECKGDDPIGVDFFISDMYELFERWQEESKDIERSMKG